jgi:hypothetical protein
MWTRFNCLRLIDMWRSLVNMVVTFRVLQIGDLKDHSRGRNWMTLEAFWLPLQTSSLQFLKLEDKGLLNIPSVNVTMS